MCIAYIAKNPFENCELLITMNRDEFYARPFSMASRHGDLYYPQDEKFGGTWFAFNQRGEFALLTNIRKFNQESKSSSRGEIPINYLANNILPNPSDYRLFNFIYGSKDSINHLSSFSSHREIFLDSSITISNSKIFPSNWSKEETLRIRFSELFAKNQKIELMDLFDTISSAEEHGRQHSDDTGYSEEVEQKLSSIFVEIPDNNYSTVHQLIFMITKDKRIEYFERRALGGAKYSEILEINFNL